MDALDALPNTTLFQQSESILAPARQDYNFPCHPDLLLVRTRKQPDMLVRVVVHGNDKPEGSQDILWHTKSMGRAGWYTERIKATIDGRQRVFGGIFVTSTGVPENADPEIAPHEIPLARPFAIMSPSHVVGAKTEADCYLDGKNSIEASKRGVRTRIPYRGYHQFAMFNSTTTFPSDKPHLQFTNTEHLSNIGILNYDSAPYSGLFLMETPFRVCDLTDIFTEKTNITDRTIVDLHTFFALELEFAKLQPDFNERFPDTKMDDPKLAQKILIFISSRLGSLEKQMREGHVYQQIGHSQNYSIHGEDVDNSTLLFNSDLESELITRWEERQRPRIDSNLMLTEFFKFTERLKTLTDFADIDPELIKFEFYKAAK